MIWLHQTANIKHTSLNNTTVLTSCCLPLPLLLLTFEESKLFQALGRLYRPPSLLREVQCSNKMASFTPLWNHLLSTVRTFAPSGFILWPEESVWICLETYDNVLLGRHLRERSVSPTSGEHHTDYIGGKLVLQTTMVDIVNLIKLYVWVNAYRFCENKYPLV